jgi:hypothetical protein
MAARAESIATYQACSKPDALRSIRADRDTEAVEHRESNWRATRR